MQTKAPDRFANGNQSFLSMKPACLLNSLAFKIFLVIPKYISLII